MTEQKVILPEEIPEMPLPEGVSWDVITSKPTSLKDISITDSVVLTTAATAAAAATAGLTDIAIQGWSLSSIFTSTGRQAIAWTSGTLKFKDGTTFSIASGSATGISTSVPTYIYFDKAVSTTVLQTTLTAGATIGVNKILVAVSHGNSAVGKLATLQAFGGIGNSTFITADNIAANSITANEIAANTITVNQLSATAIDGMTITGAIMRTAATGARVVIDGTANDVSIYDSSRRRMQLYGQGMTFWDSSGNHTADIYAGTTGGLLITTADTGSASRSIFIQAGTTGVASLGIGNTSYIYADGSGTRIIVNKDIQPGAAGVSMGNGAYTFAGIYTTALFMDSIGYVNSDGTAGTPLDSTYFTPSRTAVGKYSINHPFATTNFVVVVSALRASGAGSYSAKVMARSSTAFTVAIFDDTGAAQDSDFMFIFMPGM